MLIPAVGLLLMRAPVGAVNTGEADSDYSTDLWRPGIQVTRALKLRDASALKELVSPSILFVDAGGRTKGDGAVAKMLKQFGRIPGNVNINLYTFPVKVVRGVATLTRTATTPQVNGKSTQYRWADTWRKTAGKWRLVQVRALPNVTLVEPLPSPDNPKIRAELDKKYADYFKALLTKDAGLFSTVTLPGYTSYQQGSLRSYKKSGDPLKDKIAALEPLGPTKVKFRKLYVRGDTAVAVVDQISTMNEPPDPKADKNDFQITSITVPLHVKDTWRRTSEGWKLTKEEVGVK